jgi:hypothetical protein
MVLVEEMRPGSTDSKVRIEERVGLDGKPVRRLIIEGYALVCDIAGINGREYPSDIISREIERLNREAVPFGRLAAELNHPRLDPEGNSRDYPICEMDLSKLCAVVEELRMEGNRVYCRMVVAEDTDAGHNLAGAIKAGYRPGYSIRGAGETMPKGDHEVVTDDYTLITIDVVGNPSFGKAAIVTSRVESAEDRKKRIKVMTESVETIRREVAQQCRLRRVGPGSMELGGFLQFARESI